MQRRFLVLGIPAAAALALAGCKSAPGDELIGYWIERSSDGRIRSIARIQRQNGALVLTVAQFSALGGATPIETHLPLVYSRDLGQHGVQAATGIIPIRRHGDALIVNADALQPSTAELYAKWLKADRRNTL